MRSIPYSAFRWAPVAFFAVALLWNPTAPADVIRRELEPGVHALGRDGRTLGLEVHPPRGADAQRMLSKYLQREGDWTLYRDRLNTFVPFERLKDDHRRALLLLVFEQDTIDSTGWRHTAMFDGETLWSLSEWITGSGHNYRTILADSRNEPRTTLMRGDSVWIPYALLPPAMRKPTPKPLREPKPELVNLSDALSYSSDAKGPFALYTIKKGETLYSSVVARFTDLTDNADILQACNAIAERTGIRDVRDIDAGTRIVLPLHILADRYQPAGSQARQGYEASLLQAKKYRGNQGRSADLSDVVIILDPGHGGNDHGASHAPSGLYEDELNYDIVCRIQALLAKETGARVYVTLQDPSQGPKPVDAVRFRHDTDEVLQTSPPYKNDHNASVSANLRWMLANSIYERELKRGTDPHKIIFTSVHTDSLYNGQIRGTMVYIPGAKYRRSREVRTDAIYARYQEGRSFNRFESNSAERNRDEALSRNLAVLVLDELGRKRIKRHDRGDPIRSQIQRSKSRVFVPAVLRNTKVPTKILIETANIQNGTDRQRLSDPWWRQQFAQAYVDSLKRYFKADPGGSLAQAD